MAPRAGSEVKENRSEIALGGGGTFTGRRESYPGSRLDLLRMGTAMNKLGPFTVEGSRTMAKAIDTDACLIERFAKGDAAAFDRLFLKYQDYVYNICLGVVGNPEDARDCTQETFLKVYKNAKEFRGQSALSTWIYR